MDLKGNLLNKEQLEKISIQELLKYGKSVYYKNSALEFKDSYGPAYVEKENSTAYLINNILILRHMHQSVTGLDPDSDYEEIAERFKKYYDCSYLIIDGDKKEYLEVCSYDLESLSTHEKSLYKKAESLVQEAEEKSETVKKAERHHIRNFFKNLFRGKKAQNFMPKTSNMTSQEIQAILDNIPSQLETTSPSNNSHEKFVNSLSTEPTKSDSNLENNDYTKSPVGEIENSDITAR